MPFTVQLTPAVSMTVFATNHGFFAVLSNGDSLRADCADAILAFALERAVTGVN